MNGDLLFNILVLAREHGWDMQVEIKFPGVSLFNSRFWMTIVAQGEDRHPYLDPYSMHIWKRNELGKKDGYVTSHGMLDSELLSRISKRLKIYRVQ